VGISESEALTQRAIRKGAAAEKSGGRSNDPDKTRADILKMAISEFSEKGYDGSRVDEIAELTETSKRMIYYYYGNKEGLFHAVLEECYTAIRSIESHLDLEAYSADEALRRLVQSTFDYHNDHPEFVRLVMNENILKGVHIATLPSIKTRNKSVIEMLQRVLDRGVAAGVLRAGIDPVELHMNISALCFYNVSNRYTFSRIFDRDMTSREFVDARRESIADVILRWCAP
jgi:AcrR family transcriptional regulator